MVTCSLRSSACNTSFILYRKSRIDAFIRIISTKIELKCIYRVYILKAFNAIDYCARPLIYAPAGGEHLYDFETITFLLREMLLNGRRTRWSSCFELGWGAQSAQGVVFQYVMKNSGVRSLTPK